MFRVLIKLVKFGELEKKLEIYNCSFDFGWNVKSFKRWCWGWYFRCFFLSIIIFIFLFYI